MAEWMASRLESFFEERTDGHLRSIVNYEQREYDIVYLREDVESVLGYGSYPQSSHRVTGDRYGTVDRALRSLAP